MSSTTTTSDRRLVRTSTPGVYRRGSRYVVRYRDPQGRQRKAFARTLAEARELRATLVADVKRGEYRTLSKVTFAEYAPQWVATYQGRTRRGIRPETRADYRRALGLDEDGGPTGDGAVAFFGRMRLCEIEPRDVKRYAAEVAARGVSANTVRLALAPVKALLATAFEEGLIRSNPAAGLRIVSPQPGSDEGDGRRREIRALSEQELRRLLAETPPGWRLLVEFLAATGLRISEALALRWADLDFGRRRVRVRRRLRGGKLGPLKSDFARRDVPLAAPLAQRLWRARGKAPAEAFVFAGARGEPLDRTRCYRVVKAAAERAGVPWAGLHTLRHTAATLAFRSGWNAKQVQALLGHHSPGFTLATYVHLLPDDLPEPAWAIIAEDAEAEELQDRAVLVGAE